MTYEEEVRRRLELSARGFGRIAGCGHQETLQWEAAQLVAALAKRAEQLSEVLWNAPRIGVDRDEPEGSRYIQISDTLAKEMASSPNLRG